VSDVFYTYHSTQPSTLPGFPLYVDLSSHQSVCQVLTQIEPVDFVFHCAALSVLKECEKCPEKALAVNVPSALFEGLQQHCPAALFVHFSSDQVYAGNKYTPWKEDDALAPVNAYGRSKEAAERFIVDHFAHFLIFRSSLICGPGAALKKDLFLQVRAVEIPHSMCAIIHNRPRCLMRSLARALSLCSSTSGDPRSLLATS
jgi:dTDP-4-dehydrorhamnose reductase